MRTNPKLWESAKKEAVSKMGGKHSARAMQLAVAIYKKRGGKYKGEKSSSNSLARWTRQNWKTSDGSKSEGKKRYLPEKAWEALTPEEKAATNKAKAKGFREGKQFVRQPEKIAKKTSKYRK